MLVVTVLLPEHDACGAFGGRGSVTRAVGTGLDDMHHAVFPGIPADIERVCSHKYAAHRLYPRVKLHACHQYTKFFFASYDSVVFVWIMTEVSPRW